MQRPTMGPSNGGLPSEIQVEARVLRLHGLGDRDVKKVRAFVSLAGGRLHARWSVVLEGAADLFLVAGDAPPPRGQRGAMLRLLDAPADTSLSSQSLHKPLEYEPLIDALLAFEATSKAFESSPESDEPATVPLPPLPAEPARRERTAPVETPRPATRRFKLPTGARMRLARWPNAAQLQGGRIHTRLASFLTARSLTIDELVQLSNVPRTDCEDFVDGMGTAGLLRVEVRPVSAGNATQATPTAEANPAPERPSTSLLARFRQRLGLGGRR